MYREAVRFSGYDFNGNPQLTMLEFVMAHMDGDMTDKATLLKYIGALHSTNLQIIAEKR